MTPPHSLVDDPTAQWVVKDERVTVEFATAAGELQSAVGVNCYFAGDALLTGATGDRWSVSRGRFDARYEPLQPTARGAAGDYRNVPVPIRAKRMPDAFHVTRVDAQDRLQGVAGDWLVEYGPGDFGIVASARFAAVYRIATDQSR